MGKSSVAAEAASPAEANAAVPAVPAVAGASVPVNPRVSDEIEAQIRRLRQVLTLMAPETGSVALGSAHRASSNMPIAERIRLLTEYRR